jgi:hypothetical protein
MSTLLRSSSSFLIVVLLFGTTAVVSAGVVTYSKTAQLTLTDATGGAGQHMAATTTSTLALSVPSGLGQVIDVDVRVRLNHPNLRQLRVVLAAPNGTTVTLLENGINTSGNFILGANNASGANLEDAFFDQRPLQAATMTGEIRILPKITRNAPQFTALPPGKAPGSAGPS